MNQPLHLILRAAFLVCYCSVLRATAQPVGIATDSNTSAPQSSMTSAPASESLSLPVHSLQAFGGRLIGTDRGEWIGRLQFQDQAGGVRTILEENVLSIVKNEDDVFVFTGLDHMSMNEGLVYVVKLDTNNIPRPELLVRLPGFPSQVRQKPDGTTEFIVFTGGRDQQGRFVHECYQLAGQVVSRGAGCQPLQPAGSSD